jgi:hypothetical protein
MRQKKRLTTKVIDGIHSPELGTLLLDGSITIEQRVQLLETTGWIPGAKFLSSLARKAPGTIVKNWQRLDPLLDTPDKSAVNDTLVNWVVGDINNDKVLGSLLKSVVTYQFAIGTDDEITNDERDSLERVVMVWKAILDSSSTELRSDYSIKMRLSLLREFGYPCGSKFGYQLREVVGNRFDFLPDSDPFEGRKDKSVVDQTLSRWVAGVVNEDIALHQLTPMLVHFNTAGIQLDEQDNYGRLLLSPSERADQPFAETIFNAAEAVFSQASDEVIEKHKSEIQVVNFERSGIEIKFVEAALKKNNLDRDGNSR